MCECEKCCACCTRQENRDPDHLRRVYGPPLWELNEEGAE